MVVSYFEVLLVWLGDLICCFDVIEICINFDGWVWGEFQGDYFM